jgi:superfamily I DNA/RNA helicase
MITYFCLISCLIKDQILPKNTETGTNIYLLMNFDTDFAQDILYHAYNPGANSIMIVGDDDQACYSFRGAC